MRTEEETISSAPQPENKENEKVNRENTEPRGATVILMTVLDLKMRWTTTSEQHCSLQVVGSFFEKHYEKSTAQAHVASTAPLLHTLSKNLAQRITQRQQWQFIKRKKKERSNLFQVLPTRNWTVRGQDRSWVAIQLQIASLVTTGNASRKKSVYKRATLVWALAANTGILTGITGRFWHSSINRHKRLIFDKKMAFT